MAILTRLTARIPQPFFLKEPDFDFRLALKYFMVQWLLTQLVGRISHLLDASKKTGHQHFPPFILSATNFRQNDEIFNSMFSPCVSVKGGYIGRCEVYIAFLAGQW